MPSSVNWQMVLQERTAEESTHFDVCLPFLQDLRPSVPTYLDFSLMPSNSVFPPSCDQSSWQVDWFGASDLSIVGLVVNFLNKSCLFLFGRIQEPSLG